MKRPNGRQLAKGAGDVVGVVVCMTTSRAGWLDGIQFLGHTSRLQVQGTLLEASANVFEICRTCRDKVWKDA